MMPRQSKVRAAHLRRRQNRPLTPAQRIDVRTVLDLCQRGDRWQTSQALVLQRAFEAAFGLLDADHAGAVACFDCANWLAQRIRIGVATPAEVAGAEIYATTTVNRLQGSANGP